MRKFLLMLSLLLLFCACAPDGEAIETTSAPETEEILCTKTILIESPSLRSIDELMTVPDLLIRATVERRESGILIGEHADTDISALDQEAIRAGRLSNALIHSIYTPYTVTPDAIYKQGDAALGVGEEMQIYVQGGLVQGISVLSENPTLLPGSTYILALRRKTADDGRVWYTLQNPGNGAVAVDAEGRFSSAGLYPLYLYDQFTSLTDFETAIAAEGGD